MGTVESEGPDWSAYATGSQRRVRSSGSTGFGVAQASRLGRPSRAAAFTTEANPSGVNRWEPGSVLALMLLSGLPRSRYPYPRSRKCYAWPPARGELPRLRRSGSPPTPPLRRSEEFRLTDVCTPASVPAVGRGASVRIVSEKSPVPLRMCRSVWFPPHAIGWSPSDSMVGRTSRTVAAGGPPSSVSSGSSRRACSRRRCLDARHRI